MTMSKSEFDKDYTTGVLNFLHGDTDGVVEIRLFPKERYLRVNGRREYVGKTVSGYYDDLSKIGQDIKKFDGKGNIYFTLNPCNPALLARSANHLTYSAETTTSDDDIIVDRWFPIDIDPIRPAKISSTDMELKLAQDKQAEINEWLAKKLGISNSLNGDSGNGCHTLILLSGYPNTAETRGTKEKLIKFIAEKFTDDKVEVDETVSNMARIWKVYGTLACKGDDIPERPHRRAYLDLPEVKPEPVDLYAMLPEILPKKSVSVPEIQKSEPKSEKTEAKHDGDYPDLDVEAYLKHYNVAVKQKKEKSDGTFWELERCPFDPNHNEGEAVVFKGNNGKLGFKCHHDSCSGYHWQDFKAKIGDPRLFYDRSQKKKKDKTELDKRHHKPSKKKNWVGDRPPRDDFDLINCLNKIPENIDRFELTEKIEEIIIRALEAGEPKDKLRMWIDSKLKDKFDDIDTRNYQSMLTRLHEEYSKNQKNEPIVKNLYFIENTFIPKLLADELMRENEFIFSGGLLYVYKNGVYQAIGDQFIKQQCRKKLQEEARINRVKETIEHISDLSYVDPNELNQHSNLINFKNGMYDWINDKMLKHSTEYLSTIRIPIEYNSDAKCKNIDYFLESTLESDCIPLIEEISGYSLIPDTRFEKAVMLLGGGSNGKSTFLNLLEKFIGSENTENIPLQEIVENRFKRAELHGKLLNLFADLSSRAIESSSYFKAIVSGDKLSAERKHKDPFKFRPFCRLIFSANTLPASQDKTFAYYRRWIIIPFNRVFTGKKADKSLSAKITQEGELSGFLNRALKGLNRLFSQKEFSTGQTTQAELNDYKKRNDTVDAFIIDRCKFDPDAQVERKELFSEYCKYCKQQGYKKIENRNTCYDRIRSYQEVGEKQNTAGKYVFVGVAFKNN